MAERTDEIRAGLGRNGLAARARAGRGGNAPGLELAGERAGGPRSEQERREPGEDQQRQRDRVGVRRTQRTDRTALEAPATRVTRARGRVVRDRGDLERALDVVAEARVVAHVLRKVLERVPVAVERIS